MQLPRVSVHRRKQRGDTANAPYLCRDCYETRYGVKIPTEVDAYKARLLGVLGRYADSVEGAPARDLALRVMRLIENTD